MPNVPENFLKRVEEIYSGTIPPAEYEEILKLGSEFVAIGGEERFLILGSYDGNKEQRLIAAQDTIDTFSGSKFSAFLMSEMGNEDEALNGILKYQLLAEYATQIIVICEDDSSGVAIEQGMLVVIPGHLKKSYLCKRTYNTELERQRYSWMQTNGVFDIYEQTGRLRRWESPDELISNIQGILESIQ